MYTESLEIASAEGWKLFMAYADSCIFRNDAVRELCSDCINRGSNLYDVLNTYVTFPQLIPGRPAYPSEDIYRLVLPFLRAQGISNMYLRNYFKKNMKLAPGSDRTFRFIQEFTIPCLISSLYEHYVYEACDLLDFPIENTYSTSLDMDYWDISKDECDRLTELADEISHMVPLQNVPANVSCLEDLPTDVKNTLSRLDEIFENDMADLKSFRLLSSSTIVGPKEKSSILMDMRRKTSFMLEDVILLCSTQSDVLSSHIVKHGGGLSIAHNGSPAAICASDVAVVSDDTTVISFLADVFQNAGKECVLDLVEDWSREAIFSSPASSYLKKTLLDSSRNGLPIVVSVDSRIPNLNTNADTWMHDSRHS